MLQGLLGVSLMGAPYKFLAAMEWAAVGVGGQQLESEDPESEDHRRVHVIESYKRADSMCTHACPRYVHAY